MLILAVSCAFQTETYVYNILVLQFTEHGLEGSLLILQSCLDYMNLCGTDVKNVHLHPVVSSVFRFILDKPNFSTVLCQCLKHVTIRDGFLDDLSNALGLSLPEKIATGLAFSESENPDARLIGMVSPFVEKFFQSCFFLLMCEATFAACRDKLLHDSD